MKLLRMFGIGNKNIIEDDHYVTAVITNVTRFCGIKINNKAMRKNAADGAAFPHIITFTYNVDGLDYTGKRFIGASVIPPHINETILIYYNEAEPKKYAVEI